MISRDEKERTYTLVLELLAHQFAYPVQWIETQDSLLEQKRIERLIEIGPANTLTGLAKQTIETKYRDHDTALSIQRQLLNCKNNADDIYYQRNDTFETAPEETAKPNRKDITPSPLPESVAATSSSTVLPVENTSIAARITKTADVPIKAVDVIAAIIAQKLKKTIKDVPVSSTIKGLVGGRSTLENEIVGDLLSEFSNMPERSEELSLKDLGDTISSVGAEIRLGKQTTLLVQRVISTTMPGDVGTARLRSYLEERWGFETGRQDSVLLSAISSPPKSRLQDTKEVNGYIDTLVKEHALTAGLTLEEASMEHKPTVAANPEELNRIVQEQERLAKQKLKAYADFLKFDLQAGFNSAGLLDESISDLQRKVDRWIAEHGEAYADGITPIFEPKKLREYSSYWNWALQDLIGTFYDIGRGALELTDDLVDDIGYRLTNRSSPKLVEPIRYLLRQCHDEKSKPFFKELLKAVTLSSAFGPVFRSTTKSAAPRTAIDETGKITYSEYPRIEVTSKSPTDSSVPIRHIKCKAGKEWDFDPKMTDTYNSVLHQISHSGLSFENKTILLTGAGSNSIGAELLKGLLAGGAKVIVTTNSFSSNTALTYQKIYMAHGAKRSRLILVPFNQGSQQDIEALVEYIYSKQPGIGWDLDVVIPFAAIAVTGREIDSIDSKSELAQRIMLTNVIRLLGTIKKHKENAGYQTRPTHAILPLSPNHGIFGGDGLYAESKMALESLFAKWHSEKWGDYISICGASIGWTRGTGLMNQNDILAEDIEKLGVRTFSRSEMATSILALLSRPLVERCQAEPMYADLSGGLDTVPDLPMKLNEIRRGINTLSEIRRAVAADLAIDEDFISKGAKPITPTPVVLKKRARIEIGFPQLPNYEREIEPLHSKLDGMVSLDRIVVVVGFSELGPCGNSRTRWEMEAFDEFSLEGCTEMAWIMGLIKLSKAAGGKPSGWIDVKTGESVEEYDMKKRYEAYIRQHSGIRLIEPTLFDNYDPSKKQVIQEIVIQEDLAAFNATKETALNFKREHGDKVDIFPGQEPDSYSVIMKKGATILVPKAVKFRNNVAAQIPLGWNPRTYGITDDIIDQVDPITLYYLVSTVEALLSAGITDPYEIYNYIHVSQLGNCIGTGIGGISSLAKMHRDRFQEKPVQNDILQETFSNTVGAWVNMLLLSSSGPNRTPVGACATSLESLDAAYDLILAGKAKMCIVGGVDDFTEDLSLEFANMKATSNADHEREAGRSPKEMSRPAASSRKGFMESHGSGVQIACTAKVALEMGLPIYGIIAFTGTSSDKASRSVPAPGKGAMVNVRETSSRFPSPLLDISYRRRQIERRKLQISEFKEVELSQLEDTLLSLKAQDPRFDGDEYRRYMRKQIDLEAKMQEEEMLSSFGNHFWRDHPEISPIKGALATWGLSIDDVNVASFHGTSTVMNEKNECSIIQAQLAHLGRTKGNRILGVFQKSLTGHPKGAAGAWMLNGCLQMLRTGLVPGNRNLDNLDEEFQEFDYITFLNRNIQTDGIKAFSVTSFGFGQKGAQAIGVHPNYLFAAIKREVYDDYVTRLKKRQAHATVAFNEALLGNNMFVAKERPPYQIADEMGILMDPEARTSRAPDSSYRFEQSSKIGLLET